MNIYLTKECKGLMNPHENQSENKIKIYVTEEYKGLMNPKYKEPNKYIQPSKYNINNINKYLPNTDNIPISP